MKLFANGDSYLFGYGLTAPGTEWNDSVDDYQYASKHNMVSRLACDLGVPFSNLSLPAGSNDRMVRTTLQHLLTNGHDDTLVIIGWSKPMWREVHCINHPSEDQSTISFVVDGDSRWRRLWTTSNTLKYIPDGEEWYKNNLMYGWDYVESMVRFCQQVMLLSDWLKIRNIPHLFFTTVSDIQGSYDSYDQDTYERRTVGRFFDKMDWSEWMYYNSSIDAVSQSICRDAGELLPCSHPTHNGHALMSNTIRKCLEDRRLI